MSSQENETTPSSHWKELGEEDPHGKIYDCERAELTMGRLTDDELANAAFMNYDIRPNIQDIIDGKAFSPIVWMTAVKDRIRWLSRSLEKELQKQKPKFAATVDGKEIPPYQQRVYEELNELQERFNNLCKFLDSQSFHDVDPIQKDLLTRQKLVMKMFIDILLERISNF